MLRKSFESSGSYEAYKKVYSLIVPFVWIQMVEMSLKC